MNPLLPQLGPQEFLISQYGIPCSVPHPTIVTAWLACLQNTNNLNRIDHVQVVNIAAEKLIVDWKLHNCDRQNLDWLNRDFTVTYFKD